MGPLLRDLTKKRQGAPLQRGARFQRGGEFPLRSGSGGRVPSLLPRGISRGYPGRTSWPNSTEGARVSFGKNLRQLRAGCLPLSAPFRRGAARAGRSSLSISPGFGTHLLRRPHEHCRGGDGKRAVGERPGGGHCGGRGGGLIQNPGSLEGILQGILGGVTDMGKSRDFRKVTFTLEGTAKNPAMKNLKMDRPQSTPGTPAIAIPETPQPGISPSLPPRHLKAWRRRLRKNLPRRFFKLFE